LAGGFAGAVSVVSEDAAGVVSVTGVSSVFLLQDIKTSSKSAKVKNRTVLLFNFKKLDGY
jgi:hypothetical protein